MLECIAPSSPRQRHRPPRGYGRAAKSQPVEDNVTNSDKQPATPNSQTVSASSSTPSKARANRSTPVRSNSANQSGSKQSRVLTMLRRKDGATINAIVKATDWQPHSVRGFFAGVVRKKLKLNLESQKTNGKRVYRITQGKAATAIRAKRR